MVHFEEPESPAGAVSNGYNPTDDIVTNGHSSKPAFDTIEDTLAAFSTGSFIIVLDSPSRENEGDLILAAQHATASKLAFMIRHTSGYICAPLAASRAAALALPQMVPGAANRDPHRTAYTVTVDGLAPATTTGISAADRAATARMLADPQSGPESFRRPGHMLPLVAGEGGVRERRGHTEAAVEMCRLAGLQPAAVICEVVEEGVEVEGKAELRGAGMLRRDGCLEFGRRWGIRVCTIEDLVEFVERRKGKLGRDDEGGVSSRFCVLGRGGIDGLEDCISSHAVH